ncbi:MAG: DUF624 domain-containing protein [Clostridiales bacterium]|nr:DUF624 domain-containing protein [Clostridiales bacterium]
MGNFFNMDNRFFSALGRVADLIILNLLCIVCCIPVFTAGASITAMFYVTLKLARNEDVYIVKGFFKSFKQNFKQATIINLLMILVGVLILFDLYIARNMEGTVFQVLTVVFMVFAIVYLMIFLYIYPILAKFDNTIRNTFTNSFLMALRHLPRTILMLLISCVPVLILFIPNYTILSVLSGLFILLGFSTVAWCNSKIFVKIFDCYIPQGERQITPEEEEQQWLNRDPNEMK